MGDVGIGAVLREARTEQQRGLDEAAAATSMRVTQVEALEHDRFDTFGGDVYAKGFLKSYAKWLGLDPAPLLDRYRRYVEHDHAATDARKLASSGSITGEAPSDLPMWLVRIVALVGVVALGIGLLQFVSARVPDPAAEPVVADVPEPAAPTPTQDPSAGAGAAAPQPTASPTPTYDGVELTLAFESNSWVSVRVDGQPTQEGLFESGDVLDLQGEEEVVVLFGNAGGVTGLLNGESIGPFGDSGSVREIRFTRGGFEPV